MECPLLQVSRSAGTKRQVTTKTAVLSLTYQLPLTVLLKALAITSALDGGVGGQCHAVDDLPPGKRPNNHFTVGWVGPRAGIDGGRKSRPQLRINLLTFQIVASRYTDYTNSATTCYFCCTLLRSQILEVVVAGTCSTHSRDGNTQFKRET